MVLYVIRMNGDFELFLLQGKHLEEVVLSKTLNLLRQHDGDAHNASTTFIETLEYVLCTIPKFCSFLTA